MRLSWDEMFEKAKEYYIEHGELNPAQTYIHSDGTKLGAWVNTQRAVRNGIRSGIMNEERIKKLDSIGIDWDPNSTAWNKGFNELKDYYSEHGDTDVPLRYVSISGYKLGLWLQNQRRSYWNKGRGALNEEQINRLASLDISWDPHLSQWMRNLDKLKKYYLKYGNVDLPKNYTVNGVNLFRWLDTQRQTLNGKGKGKLNRKQRRLLREVGVNPRNKLDLRWEEMFKLAEMYYQKYGHLSMLQSYSTEEGVNLGSWIFTQRNNWKSGILDAYRESQLNSIGMVWDYTSKKQTSFFEQAIYYYFSKIFSDAVSRDKSLGAELDIYIPSIKTAIEYDGQVFHDGIKRENDEWKNKLCKESGVTLYRIREKDCPKMKDEKNNIYLQENTIDFFEDSLLLLFTKMHIDNIPAIDVNKDCGAIFGQFLMIGPPIVESDNSNYILTPEWMGYYKTAKEYYEEFGNLLILKDVIYREKDLGLWISNQRRYYNSKAVPYPEQKIRLLESIGMVWDLPQYKWEMGYHYAKLFFKDYGHLNVPSDYTVDGYELGIWIQNQRAKKTEKYKTSGKLTAMQIERLEEIGMLWNSLDHRWEEMFSLAENYYKENGNLRIPFEFVVCDKKIGRWISQQRRYYKTGTNKCFTKERISRLEEIGMEWEIGKGNTRPNNFDENWEKMFSVVYDYIVAHPDVHITKRLSTEDNIQIGCWVYRQKRIYEGKAIGVLKEWMVEKLKSIGLV